MRRAHRELLPALSFVYGITGDDLETMPFGEVSEYVEQLPKLLKLKLRIPDG